MQRSKVQIFVIALMAVMLFYPYGSANMIYWLFGLVLTEAKRES